MRLEPIPKTSRSRCRHREADVDERFRPERHPMPQIFGIGS
jgi:hypothetical protein